MKIGNFLIAEDELDTVSILFVPGGSSFDRGNTAAELFKKGIAGKIVCTGQNIPELLKALQIQAYTEAEITAMNLYRNGIDSSSVEVRKIGTSTYEECLEIVSYCKQHNIQKAIVLTDRFHTNRLSSILDKVNVEHSVTFLFAGAPSSIYSEERWWESEEGLIMVNNEYVKSLYYFFKY